MANQDLTVSLGADLGPLVKALQEAAASANATGAKIGAALETAGQKVATGLGASAKAAGDALDKGIGAGAGKATGHVGGMLAKMRESMGDVGKMALGLFGGGLLLQGAGGVSSAFSTIIDKGKGALEVSGQLALGFKQTGLSGAALSSELSRTGDFADKLSTRFAVENTHIQALAAQAAFLGGAVGPANDKIVTLATGVEKATGGMVSGEAAVRIFTKGLTDPDAEASLGRLAIKFPTLATALKSATGPADMLAKANAFLGPTFVTLEEQAKGPLGSMTRFKNAIEDTAEALGSFLITAIGPILSALAAIGSRVASAMGAITSFLGPLTPILGVIASGIVLIVGAIIAYNVVSGMAFIKTSAATVALVAHNIATTAGSIAKGVAAAATFIFSGSVTMAAVATAIATAATWAWNAALAIALAPITLIIAGIATLAVGVLYLTGAFDKSATSRKKDVDAMVDANATLQQETATRIAGANAAVQAGESYLKLAGATARTDDEAAQMHESFQKLRDAFPGIVTAEEGTAAASEQMRAAMAQARGETTTLTGEMTRLQKQGLNLKVKQAQAELEVLGEELVKMNQEGWFNTRVHSNEVEAATNKLLKEGTGLQGENLVALREALVVAEEKGDITPKELSAGLKIVDNVKAETKARDDAKKAAEGGAAAAADGAANTKTWAEQAKDLAAGFDAAHDAAAKAVKQTISGYAETLDEERKVRADENLSAADRAAKIANIREKRAQLHSEGLAQAREKHRLDQENAAAIEAIDPTKKNKPASSEDDSRKKFDKRRRVIEDAFAEEKAGFETALVNHEITQAQYRDKELVARRLMDGKVLALEEDLGQKTGQTKLAIAKELAEQSKNSYADAAAAETIANDRMVAKTRTAAATVAITKDAADARAKLQESQFRKKMLDIAREWGQDADAALRAYNKAREDQQIAADERDAKRREDALKNAVTARKYHADAELALTAEGRARDEAELAKWHSEQLNLVIQGQAGMLDVQRLYDKKRRDIEEKYADFTKASAKVIVAGFMSPMSQLFDWLDKGWQKSLHNQETVLVKSLAAMSGAVKGALLGVVQGAFEKFFTTLATDAPKALGQIASLGKGIGDVFSSLGKWIWKGIGLLAEWIASIFVSEAATEAKSGKAIAAAGAEAAAGTAAIATTTAAAAIAAGVVSASMTAIAAASAAAATLVSIATFGAAAAAGEAAVLASIAATKGAMLFAKGGLAVIGERGPEVVAPAEDFSHLMGLVARQTAEATRAALALPGAGGGGNNQSSEIVRELRSLREDVRRQKMRVEVDAKFTGKTRVTGSDLETVTRQRAREKARVV